MAAPGIRTASVLQAGAAGALLALVIIVVVARGDVDDMTYGDGYLYRGVAQNLTASRAEADARFAAWGTSRRYGRIAFPALLWATSGGRPRLMPYVQPLLVVLSAGAAAAAARLLFPTLGIAGSFTPYLAVGFLASLLGGYGEPMAVAAALWGVVLSRERSKAAPIVIAIALLTRENAVAIPVGLVAWMLVRRRSREAALIGASLLPLLGWYSVVAWRFGSFPLLDRVGEGVRAFGPPFVALWRALTDLDALTTFIVGVHVAAAVAAIALWRRSDLAAIAAASAPLLILTGPHQWGYIGDGVRLMVFLEVFVLLAALSMLAERSSSVLERS